MKKYSYKGGEYTLNQIAKMISMKPSTLYKRINEGWEIEKATQNTVYEPQTYTFNGVTKTWSQWIEGHDIHVQTFKRYIKKGMNPQEAIDKAEARKTKSAEF